MIYLIGSEGDFSAAPGATSDGAVVAQVADAVSELGLEAYVTRGIELDARLLVLLVPRPYRVLQYLHLVSLSSATQTQTSQ